MARRLDAPNRFMDELAKMIEVLESAPMVGPIHRPREPVIRRVLMKRTRHHLYYRWTKLRA